MPQKEKVTRIIDGDTFRTADRAEAVRLANVDAPERGEPGHAGATFALRRLIGDKVVSVRAVARDSYGRTVAEVKIGERSVNEFMREMVKQMGW
ncbi:MAG: thermonuclease family protein [Alphaproteobacteria bacterium]|nr:thermonuclease family protein [Alphaproteobacteria bacterium]MDA7984291.1 thermonuclease family protein [Alphaproteobacteria bacterium]